jgi:hypothetical protein
VLRASRGRPACNAKCNFGGQAQVTPGVDNIET